MVFSTRYSELRERIAKLGLNQSSMARHMRELGDHRPEKNILRSIQRMVSGEARISGEMRALLGLMERQAAEAARQPEMTDKMECEAMIGGKAIKSVTLLMTWHPGPEKEQRLYVGEFYCGLVQASGRKFDAISDYCGCFSCGHDTSEAAMNALESAVIAMGVQDA